MERHTSLPAIVTSSSHDSSTAALRQAMASRDAEARKLVKLQKEYHKLHTNWVVRGVKRSNARRFIGRCPLAQQTYQLVSPCLA